VHYIEELITKLPNLPDFYPLLNSNILSVNSSQKPVIQSQHMPIH